MNITLLITNMTIIMIVKEIQYKRVEIDVAEEQDTTVWWYIYDNSNPAYPWEKIGDEDKCKELENIFSRQFIGLAQERRVQFKILTTKLGESIEED